MNILYIGDIMGDTGVRTVQKILPTLIKENNVDVTIAQAENVSNGKGITQSDFLLLKNIGIDFCTGGNWTIHNPDIYTYLSDPNQPIIRPANYPANTPGLGYKYLQTHEGKILIISLIGHIVGKDADKRTDNPLQVIDTILENELKTNRPIATVVNFHGDFSSEKRIIGHYLDGKVSAVIGDHWHIPTADTDILPKGTAHVTDVGMCGSLDSSLGIKFSSVIPRWKDGIPTRNILENEGRLQFNALLFSINTKTGLATSANHIHKIWDQ